MFKKLIASALSLNTALLGIPFPVLATDGGEVIMDGQLVESSTISIQQIVENGGVTDPLLEQMIDSQAITEGSLGGVAPDPAEDANEVPPEEYSDWDPMTAEPSNPVSLDYVDTETEAAEEANLLDPATWIALGQGLVAAGQGLASSLLDDALSLKFTAIKRYGPMEKLYNALLNFVGNGVGATALVDPLQDYRIFLNNQAQQLPAGQEKNDLTAQVVYLDAIIGGMQFVNGGGGWPVYMVTVSGQQRDEIAGLREGFRTATTGPDYTALGNWLSNLLDRAGDPAFPGFPALTADQRKVIEMMQGVIEFYGAVMHVTAIRSVALSMLKDLLQQLIVPPPPAQEEEPVSPEESEAAVEEAGAVPAALMMVAEELVVAEEELSDGEEELVTETYESDIEGAIDAAINATLAATVAITQQQPPAPNPLADLARTLQAIQDLGALQEGFSAIGQVWIDSFLDAVAAFAGHPEAEIYAPMERILNSLLDFVRTGVGGAELLAPGSPLRAYEAFLEGRYRPVEQEICAQLAADQPLNPYHTHLVRARSQLAAIIQGVTRLLEIGDPTCADTWGSYNTNPALDPDEDMINGQGGFRPDFMRLADRLALALPARDLDLPPGVGGGSVFNMIGTLITRAGTGARPALTADQQTVFALMRGVASFDFYASTYLQISRRRVLNRLNEALQRLNPPPPQPPPGPAPEEEDLSAEPASDPVMDPLGVEGTSPVLFEENQEPMMGAALDADLDRISGIFDNVGTVGAGAPVYQGINSLEANVVNNYLGGLWGGPGETGLLEHMARLAENPASMTEAQRNRIRTLFEIHYRAMIVRAANPPLGAPVDIATGKLGVMLVIYIRSGLATPTQAVLLYRETVAHQDAWIGRMRDNMAAGTAAADFRTPYDNAVRPFSGYLGGTAAMLNMAETHLIPLLSQGMALTAMQQIQAREEIRTNATNRMTRVIEVCEGAQRLGISTSVFLGVGLDDGLFKTWADVMRAVANMVTAGEDAADPARSVYPSVTTVIPRMRTLVALLYSLDNHDGLSVSQVVLEEMPMGILPSLTDAQKGALLLLYRAQAQTVRSRLITLASNAASDNTAGNAGRISGLVGAAAASVTAMQNLVGTTITQAEWETICTEIGHALRLVAERVGGMEASFLRMSSVESLSNSAGAFAFAIAQMLENPPFAGMARDQLQALSTLVLGLFPPILQRLQNIAPCPSSSDNAETMAQMIRDSAQCGYEFLQNYLQNRLAAAPAPPQEPVP